jgi:hypothetical protein
MSYAVNFKFNSYSKWFADLLLLTMYREAKGFDEDIPNKQHYENRGEQLPENISTQIKNLLLEIYIEICMGSSQSLNTSDGKRHFNYILERMINVVNSNERVDQGARFGGVELLPAARNEVSEGTKLWDVVELIKEWTNKIEVAYLNIGEKGSYPMPVYTDGYPTNDPRTWYGETAGIGQVDDKTLVEVRKGEWVTGVPRYLFSNDGDLPEMREKILLALNRFSHDYFHSERRPADVETLWKFTLDPNTRPPLLEKDGEPWPPLPSLQTFDEKRVMEILKILEPEEFRLLAKGLHVQLYGQDLVKIKYRANTALQREIHAKIEEKANAQAAAAAEAAAEAGEDEDAAAAAAAEAKRDMLQNIITHIQTKKHIIDNLIDALPKTIPEFLRDNTSGFECGANPLVLRNGTDKLNMWVFCAWSDNTYLKELLQLVIERQVPKSLTDLKNKIREYLGKMDTPYLRLALESGARSEKAVDEIETCVDANDCIIKLTDMVPDTMEEDPQKFLSMAWWILMVDMVPKTLKDAVEKEEIDMLMKNVVESYKRNFPDSSYDELKKKVIEGGVPEITINLLAFNRGFKSELVGLNIMNRIKSTAKPPPSLSERVEWWEEKISNKIKSDKDFAEKVLENLKSMSPFEQQKLFAWRSAAERTLFELPGQHGRGYKRKKQSKKNKSKKNKSNKRKSKKSLNKSKKKSFRKLSKKKSKKKYLKRNK